MQQLTASTTLFMTLTETNFKDQDASNHNLEVHVYQIAYLQVDPRNHCQATETNPKEHVKVITLRSGITLEQNQESNTETVYLKDTGEKYSENERKISQSRDESSAAWPTVRPAS